MDLTTYSTGVTKKRAYKCKIQEQTASLGEVCCLSL